MHDVDPPPVVVLAVIPVLVLLVVLVVELVPVDMVLVVLDVVVPDVVVPDVVVPDVVVAPPDPPLPPVPPSSPHPMKAKPPKIDAKMEYLIMLSGSSGPRDPSTHYFGSAAAP